MEQNLRVAQKQAFSVSVHVFGELVLWSGHGAPAGVSAVLSHEVSIDSLSIV